MKYIIIRSMTFLIISILIISAFSIFVYAGGIGENLIENPGFENGSEFWTLKDTDKGFVDSSVYHSGARSLKLEGSVQRTYWMSDLIPVDVSKPYTFSAYVKTDSVTTNSTATDTGVYMKIQRLKADKTGIAGMQSLMSVSGTTDWTKYSRDMSALFTDETAYIRIYYYIAAGETGNAWLDDVKFYRTPVPAEFEINGEQNLMIPFSGQTDTAYSATLKDSDGNEFTYDVIWTAEPQDIKGVTVNENGVVSVTGYAEPTTQFELVATLADHPEYEKRIMITLLYELTQTDIDNIIGYANTYSVDELAALFNDDSYRKALVSMELNLSDYQSLVTSDAKKIVCSLLVQGRNEATYDAQSLKSTFNSAVIMAAVSENTADKEMLIQVLKKYQSAIGIDMGDGSVWNSLCTEDKSEAKQNVLDDVIDGDPYDSLQDIKNIFQTSVAVNSVNCATWGEIEKLLEDNTILKFSEWEAYDEYNNLSESNKATVCKAMVGQAFADIDSIKTAFAAQVEQVENSASVEIPSNPFFGGGGGGISSVITVKNSEQEETDEEKISTEENVTLRFSDIDDVEWAHEAIYELASYGIVEGTGNGLFEPNDNVTKEQFLKMLLECFGLTDNDAKSSLKDISASAWYYKYLASAEKYDIIEVDGTGFEINKDISRWEMAYYIYRVSQIKDLKLNSYDEEGAFDDISELSDEVRGAVRQLKGAKIVNGIGNNLFAPYNNATRAEASVIIHRLHKLQNNN